MQTVRTIKATNEPVGLNQQAKTIRYVMLVETMCKKPTKGVRVLLLAWETPPGQEALKGDRPGSMSIEFSRELLKAYVSENRQIDFTLCKRARDQVFWNNSHPCCVIDAKNIGTNALLQQILNIEPMFVILLGSKVQARVSKAELQRPDRVILSLGFPYGGNQRDNVEALRQQDELRELLLPSLKAALVQA